MEALVTIDAACGRRYPYWLLGWVHVGHDRDPTQPAALDNAQFLHSLRRMGFDVPAWSYDGAEAWKKRFMSSLEGYRELKRALGAYPHSIEPVCDVFPTRPRLCRRWWDRKLILGRKPGIEVPRWVAGWGVLRRSPWHFVKLFGDQASAQQAARQAGPEYEVIYGEHLPGTDDFVWEGSP